MKAAEQKAAITVPEDVKPEEAAAAPIMSFKGLKACPACGKEMTRGLYMHYMKKHK